MTEKPDEGDNPVVRKEPCPECTKKGSLQVFLDGSKACFTRGCGFKIAVTGDTNSPPQAAIPKGLIKPGQGAFSRLDQRRIDGKTLRKYGTFMGGLKGQKALIAPLFSDTGDMVAQIARLPDGTQEAVYTQGTGPAEDIRTTQLYGRHVYGDRYDRKVVITSDFLDALSGGQVSTFKLPVVALTGSKPEHATVSIKANYRWLDRFGEIILFFKRGDEWDRAARDCAALFDPGRVKIARLEDAGFQTVNDALQADKPGDIEAAIWAAHTWRPVGIVNASEGLSDVLEGGLQVPSWPYPWDVFNDWTMGMRPGEVTYHVGGTGIAKTTLMFHYAVALLRDDGGAFIANYPRQEPAKVGWMGFEDTLKSVKMGLLSVANKRRIALEVVSTEDATRWYTELFGSGRMELYDPQNAEYGLEPILGYIKYMARALGVNVFFIDPLTYLVAGLPVANRTSAEDQVAATLATFARSMNIHIHIGYHLKKADGTPFEEGGEVSIQDIKGSGALYQFSNNVFAYERDQQGTRPDLLLVRCLKLRAIGRTGVLGVLKYDLNSGVYAPTREVMPVKDKGRDKAKAGGSGFPQGKDY